MDSIDKYIQVKSNDLAPATGRLLLSEPLMGDYYFGRSVILLAEHNDEGSFGVIINKPLTQPFNEAVPNFPAFTGNLHLGGPVENNALFYIHTFGDLIEGSVPIGNGFYWGGEIEMIKELILFGKLSSDNISFYAGYSGWSPSQLQSELKRNSWVVSACPTDNVLNFDAGSMWQKLLVSMGDEYKYWSKFPKNPGMN
ncbi:MAG: YqgE/AlgH family protein [Bacteroidales bacterium]|nr:YqgE/AlgH family protein [Bacteroidales bacterium]